MEITSQDALIIIDVQNDFCPGGALAVAEGDAVIDPIQRIAVAFEHIILTQDWHPAGIIPSLASATPASSPSSRSRCRYGMQTLWPDHCVQGSQERSFIPSCIYRWPS